MKRDRDKDRYQIVGIVRNAKHNNVRAKIEAPSHPTFRTLVLISPFTSARRRHQKTPSTIRTATEPDSKLVLASFRTMEEQMLTLTVERMIALLATSFAILAISCRR